jgi:hypothetical protein
VSKRTIGIAIVIAAAAVALWAIFFRGSDEDRIRAVIVKAATAVRVVEGENPVLRAARVKGDLGETLDRDVAFTVPELNASGEGVGKGRDAAVAAALSAGGLWSSAEVSIAFSRVTVDPGGNTASAQTTVTLSAIRGGQRERDVRQVSFELRKLDGEFRIVAVTVQPRETS